MDNQIGSPEKRAKADVIIENSGEKEELFRLLDELLKSNEK
jgi:dephospho-CoA kinase